MPPAPVRVPIQWPIAPSVVSVKSVANDKGDNEMIPGAEHRSPGICLRAEENWLCDQSLSQWDSFPLNEVGRSAQYVRMGERSMEGEDGVFRIRCYIT